MRTLVDPADPDDVAAVNTLQDQFVTQPPPTERQWPWPADAAGPWEIVVG